MFKLEKLELNGFKSFNSKTEFVVGTGITAIVGPNGCGKSNIADAINWVIGEQSTKSLRAEQMGDVIFNGTDARKPMGLAEVTLHLKAPGGIPAAEPGMNGNGDGQPEPQIQDSVQITRRLFRGGTSEYLIDGQRRRLRDVQELLAGIHVGTGVYSIIEQGRVDAVITSRPRDRRILIEEAAGIALYRVRKRQAQAKLEATEANLLRINDIVSEIGRQIGSLKRQAARARRYARIAEAIDRAERIFIYQEAVKLDSLWAVLRSRRTELQAVESASAAQLGRAEASLAMARAAETGEATLHHESKDALHALDRSIDALKARMDRSGEQKVEAATQMERGNAEIEELTRRLDEARGRGESLRVDMAAVAAACSERETALRDEETLFRLDTAALLAMEAALEGVREELASVAGDLGDRRSEMRRLRESISRTEEELRRLDHLGEATETEAALLREKKAAQEAGMTETEAALTRARARADEAAEDLALHGARREALLMERQEKIGRAAALEERLVSLRSLAADPARRVEGLEGAGELVLLKDLLAPPERFDRAVDAALKGLLLGYVTPTLESAATLLAGLRDGGRGRAILIPSDGVQAGGSAAGLPGAGLLGTLRELLDPASRLGPGLGFILEGVVVAEDFSSAQAVRRESPGRDVVTLQGDLLSRDGWIEGGAQMPEEAGVMTLRRLIERLDVETRLTRERIGALVGEMEDAEGRMEALRIEERNWREREAVFDREAGALRLRNESLEEESSRMALQREAQAGERARHREDLGFSERELESETRRHEDLHRRHEELQRRLESLTGATEERRSLLRIRTGSLAALRDGAYAARERRAAIEADCRHHEAFVGETGQRLVKEGEKHQGWQERLAEARAREEEDGAALSDRMAERILASGRVASTEASLQERRHAVAGLEAAEREARATLEQERGRRHALDIEEEHVAGDRRNLEARVAERGLPGISAATGDLAEEERQRDPDHVRDELAELKSKRDAMGPVNLMAMEQFRELEERHAFISSQRNDLQQSIRSLQETIARINRQSRERFTEALERIRAHFTDLFAILFGGGRADLRLVMEGEGEEDVLEAGLEITAQPPGKRLQSLSLLSGGEKALTAVALLFAIFKYQPSPFCLLDEVDAPLDEANVNRFVSLLKKMSEETQFIVVSHNRRTMEAADLLYGVTMEEPGVSRSVSVVMGSEEARREAARTLPEMMASRHRGTGRAARPVPGAAVRSLSE